MSYCLLHTGFSKSSICNQYEYESNGSDRYNADEDSAHDRVFYAKAPQTALTEKQRHLETTPGTNMDPINYRCKPAVTPI
jgi:hypothetical protein